MRSLRIIPSGNPPNKKRLEQIVKHKTVAKAQRFNPLIEPRRQSPSELPATKNHEQIKQLRHNAAKQKAEHGLQDFKKG
jgi:hypothetical protein